MGPAPLPTFSLPFLGPFWSLPPNPLSFQAVAASHARFALPRKGECVPRVQVSGGEGRKGGDPGPFAEGGEEQNRLCASPTFFPNRLEDKKRGLGSLLAQQFCKTFCRQYTYILLKCAKANLPICLGEVNEQCIATCRDVL